MTRQLLVATLGVVACAAAATAQNNVRIMGRVVSKDAQTTLAGADVELYPGPRRVTTAPDGRFRYDSVAAGIVTLVAKRFGFKPESLTARVQPNEDLDVVLELERTAQALDTINVEGDNLSPAERKLAGFNERRKFGIGRFFDSATLLQEKNRKLGEFITSRTSGSRLVRSRMGSAAWVATTRISGGYALGGGGNDLAESDRSAGADPRACYPDVYVDGALLYSHGSRALLFDINSYSTNDVVAVEFYVSASQVPVQFNKTGAACGVLALWTK